MTPRDTNLSQAERLTIVEERLKALNAIVAEEKEETRTHRAYVTTKLDLLTRMAFIGMGIAVLATFISPWLLRTWGK